MRIPTYTNHGLLRAQERSIVPPEILAGLFVSESAITLGSEKNRSHQLIYSLQDADHLIGVIDTKTQEIITVLPPNYHENVAWVISPEALDMAKELAHGKPRPAPITSRLLKKRISVILKPPVERTEFLGHLDIPAHIKELGLLKELQNFVVGKLQKKYIPLAMIDRVVVTSKKGSHPITLTGRDLEKWQ